MPRSLFISTALSVLALVVAACGDDGGDSDGSADDKAEIARVIELEATSDDPRQSCTKLATESFVKRVYGSAARCIRIEKNDEEEAPPKDVPVSGIEIDGDAATAQTRFIGGDGDGAAGTIEVRKENGEWRVDDYGADLLRSVFKLGLEAQLEKGENFSDPKARACVTKLVTDLPDARLKRLTYDAAGEREGADAEFVELLTPCVGLARSGSGSGGQSLVREKFEEGLRESMREKDYPASAISCVVKKMRSAITDEELGATVTENDNKPSPRMRRVILTAFAACGATTGGGTSQ